MFPLLFLTCTLWLYWLGQAGKAGLAASRAGAVAMGLCGIFFASQFTMDYFYGWRFDAGAKRIAKLLREHRPVSALHPGQPVRVGATLVLSHSMDFYRRLYRMDWVAPITRAPLDCMYDYYVIREVDAPEIARFHPRVLYRDGAAQRRAPSAASLPSQSSICASLEGKTAALKWDGGAAKMNPPPGGKAMMPGGIPVGLSVPIATLPSGRYQLEVTATAGADKIARRTVDFEIK